MRKKLLFVSILSLNSLLLLAQKNEVENVKAVMAAYNKKIESQDTTGITQLFLPGAKVFEGGKDEGGIQGYLDHHLAPELKHFNSFTFSDYMIYVKLMGNYAYATETYKYDIELAKDKSLIRSQGVATSVLRKTPAGWKIEMMHGSYRKLK